MEIGVNEDHVHFLIQSVPTMPPNRIVQIVKSIIAKEIFRNHPEVKKILYNGHFWSSGYYIKTVSCSEKKQVIRKYIRNQGKQYKKIYHEQLSLFDDIA